MTPQLSKQQLEHMLQNVQKRVDAKKLEAHSYAQFRDYAPAGVMQILGDDPATYPVLGEATKNLFTAKLNQALVDLEELELTLKAYKQMSSGIVVPGMQMNQNPR